MCNVAVYAPSSCDSTASRSNLHKPPSAAADASRILNENCVPAGMRGRASECSTFRPPCRTTTSTCDGATASGTPAGDVTKRYSGFPAPGHTLYSNETSCEPRGVIQSGPTAAAIEAPHDESAVFTKSSAASSFTHGRQFRWRCGVNSCHDAAGRVRHGWKVLLVVEPEKHFKLLLLRAVGYHIVEASLNTKRRVAHRAARRSRRGFIANRRRSGGIRVQQMNGCRVRRPRRRIHLCVEVAVGEEDLNHGSEALRQHRCAEFVHRALQPFERFGALVRLFRTLHEFVQPLGASGLTKSLTG